MFHVITTYHRLRKDLCGILASIIYLIKTRQRLSELGASPMLSVSVTIFEIMVVQC